MESSTHQLASVTEQFALRLTEALQIAGLSIDQAARRLDRPKGLLVRWCAANALPAHHDHYLELAELCGVDPRWLATGQFSRASGAIIHALDTMNIRVGEDRDKLRHLFARATVEPAFLVGICRYCGCVEERACPGGCCWVDHEETICSACLDPTRLLAEVD